MEISKLKSYLLTYLPKNSAIILLYFFWLLLALLLLYKSWVCEDAYISFRVIDNFVNGYGLRWNITERVQAFTHPLWLLLHIPFAFLSNNLFLLNITLSLICSTLAVGIVLFTFRNKASTALIFFLLPLFLSRAFIDYAGSGLETPLSFLIFALLGYVILHLHNKSYFLFLCSLLMSLLLLNRFDHLLMILPLMLWLYWQNRKKFEQPKDIIFIILGALPLFCWLGFSLLYYGFIFPNTKYAKLDTGFPLSDYIEQGLNYSFIWLTHDTASVVVLAASILTVFLQKKSLEVHKMIAIGILLNICYVILIGGDYMMGRFFAFIFFVSAWLLLATAPLKPRNDVLFSAALLFIIAYIVSLGVREIRKECETCIPIHGRVIDARAIFKTNSLFTSLFPPKTRSEGQYKFAYKGKEMAKENPPQVKPLTYIGMTPYYAGAQAIFIDELALADPLLARLPARTDRPFYVGHYRRKLPKGYFEAIKNDNLDKMQPNLAFYYSKLRLITRGELLSAERLMTIIRFNFGEYEHDRKRYLESTQRK